MKGVLWDLDGTLVDSEPAHAAAFDAALELLGLSVPEDFHLRLLGASETHVHAALVAETGATLDRDSWRGIKWGRYQAAAARITRLPAAALLPSLVQAGVPMAVVSNSTRAEVDLNLATTGLAAFLPVTISLDDVTRGKPDPEGYRAAARRLGLAPADCVVVEDSPTGAAAGVAAGMATIFHPQVEGLPAPDSVLRAGPDGLGALFARLGLPVPTTVTPESRKAGRS